VSSRLAAALAAVALLVGCGGIDRDAGTASLWVTRDRGERVLLTDTVPAGLTAMQALKRKASVETRYGGRYVQAINGIKGSLARRRDWFYFVNGFESDRGAVEYRLHAGDVLWWDFRSWERGRRLPVVVGAFPEPFLHGFGGKRRRAVVRYGGSALAAGAHAIGRLIGAGSVAPASRPAPRDANVFLIVEGLQPRFEGALRDRGSEPGDPVVFTFVGDAVRLARNPRLVRFRYQGMP